MKTKFIICLLALTSIVSAADDRTNQTCSEPLNIAGGGSSVGPGSPQWQYSCSDEGKNIHVTILRTPPSYDNDQIAVQTVVPMSMHIEKNLQRKAISMPGAPLVFEGKRFIFSITVNGPIFKDGKTYFSATLMDRKSWESTQKLTVLCEAL